jgi:hypothetical protein
VGSFGSTKLYVTWASFFVVIFAVFFYGFGTSEGPDGFRVHAFGATVPQSLLSSVSEFADPMQFVRSVLRAFICWAVPFTFFATAFFRMPGAAAAGTFKGFCLQVLHGAGWGLFYSQLLILPVWAFCARVMGSPLPLPLLLADAHALVLGLQLLIWGLIFNRLIGSNRGVPMLLALGLGALGTKLYYFVDFGGAFGMTPRLVKCLEILNHVLPSSHVAEEPVAWATLVYGVLGTFLLASLLALIPGGDKEGGAATADQQGKK